MTDLLVDIIIATFITLGVVLALSVIYKPKNLWVALSRITLSLYVPFALYTPLTDALGYSVQTTKGQIDKFLSYTVDPSQTWIFIWVFEFETKEPRSYKIPYSQENEKKLEEAAENDQKGVPQGVKIPSKPETTDKEGEAQSPVIKVLDLDATSGVSKNA